LPEMNCYDLPENDIDYYRLGNRHRVVVNRLPYFQDGRLAANRCPIWRDGQMDWQAYDAHYRDLFSGRAFADLPRGEIPIECFYLPMHENWPSPMEGNYNGDYWRIAHFRRVIDKLLYPRWSNTLITFRARVGTRLDSKSI
jgi:hypothetical protein